MPLGRAGNRSGPKISADLTSGISSHFSPKRGLHMLTVLGREGEKPDDGNGESGQNSTEDGETGVVGFKQGSGDQGVGNEK